MDFDKRAVVGVMLAGRMPELQYLNQYYDQRGSQILVVYGQRHIGKTTLIKEFMEDKSGYYYLARACSDREQMFQWGMQLRADEIIIDKDFPEINDIFTAICESDVSKKVIVIDEFQNMVKKLGFETIAEGVETQEQYDYLSAIDCDNIQGYYLGKPMPPEDIEKLIEKALA